MTAVVSALVAAGCSSSSDEPDDASPDPTTSDSSAAIEPEIEFVQLLSFPASSAPGDIPAAEGHFVLPEKVGPCMLLDLGPLDGEGVVGVLWPDGYQAKVTTRDGERSVEILDESGAAVAAGSTRVRFSGDPVSGTPPESCGPDANGLWRVTDCCDDPARAGSNDEGLGPGG